MAHNGNGNRPGEGQAGRASEGVRVGLDAGSQDADQIRAATATAVRQLLICVGGTGLKTLEHLATIMQCNNMRFGDESQGGRQPIICHAVFVDTDLSATKEARGGVAVGQEDEEDKEAREKRELIESLKPLGVHVVDLFVDGQEQFLLQSGLANQVTPGRPRKEDRGGSRADPRVGELKYLTVRDREDDTNPRYVAEKIVRSWLQGGNAFLDKQTFLTVVGGLHGGTGQVALPLMADVRRDMIQALRGSGTSVETERYSMTAESAGIDEKRRADGKQKRRKLNTAAGVIRANAADVQGGLEVMPGQWVDGIPAEFHFILNGSSPHRAVGEDGGHYTPAKLIAKAIATRLLGTDMSGTGRSNADFDRSPDLVSGVDVPNKPQAVFSTLGVAEIVPQPDRANLTADKRRVVFDSALGVNQSNPAEVEARRGMVFPRTLLDSILEQTVAPHIVATQFGDGVDAKNNAETERDRFVQSLQARLTPILGQSLIDARDGKKREIADTTAQLKQTYGLQTALAFLTAVSAELDKLTAEANQKLERDCPPAILRADQQQAADCLRRIRSTSIFPWNIFGLRDTDLAKLRDRLNALAQALTQYAEHFKNHHYLNNVEQKVLNPIRQTVRDLLAQLEQEHAQAAVILRDIAPDPKDMAFPTPFDVPVVANLGIDATDAPALRGEYLDEAAAWTEGDMRELLRRIQVTADEIDLTDQLSPQVIDGLERCAHPLIHPVTLAGAKIAMSMNSVVTVPARTAEEAERVPAPEGAQRKRVRASGPYLVLTEQYGVDTLLEDGYVRSCVEDLLATPPTLVEAERLADMSPTPETKKKLNREAQFTFKGQMKKFLPPVFEALAKRKQLEAGGRGDTPTCTGTNCGVMFYRSEAEIAAGTAACCPGCRKLQPINPTGVASGSPR